MKVMVYTTPDGVAVEIPAPGFLAKFPSEDAAIEALRARFPRLRDAIVKDHTELPPDREFRKAWRLSAGAVVEDEAAARDELKEKLVEKRRAKAYNLAAREIEGENVAQEKAQFQAFNVDAHLTGKTVAEMRMPEVANPPELDIPGRGRP